MLVLFTSDEPTSIAQVGGKAASLIRLQQGGAHVPSGCVLTREFFEPWFAGIEGSDEWQSVVAMIGGLSRRPDLAARSQLADACDRVKEVARQFDFSREQRAALGAMETIGSGPFAVRSSSPEEDLTGASFAGMYETVLDVAADDVEDAIRTCFASCLDSRVLLYKHEMQFASLAPAIAVVVQQLVASETSGVAFSLNPLTNDYDEILINAGWGLGEALVSGDITPDSAVVNKVNGAVIEHRAGNKGGDRSTETCLSDRQIDELAAEVKRIEALLATPVDVEWAFSGGTLHILQARPITTYVPLAENLLTEPGAPRQLYFDGYLTDGITMSGPISPMSNDLMNQLMRSIFDWAYVPVHKQRFDDYGLHLSAGRMYLNASAYLHFLGNGKALAKQAALMEPTVAAIFTSPDLDRYRPATIPKHLRRRAIFLHIPAILWRTRRAIKVVIRAMAKPKVFKAEYGRIVADYEHWVRRPIEFERPVVDVFREDMTHTGTAVMDSSYPAFAQFYIATSRLKRLVDENDREQVALVDALLGGYEDDMVVRMGHEIFDMGTLLPAQAFDDLEALETQIESRSLSDVFLEKWDSFMFDYGHRGPLEMDIVNPRYADSPRLVLQQIANLAKSGGEFNPHDMRKVKVQAREAAYEKLQEFLPARKVKKLKKLYADVMYYASAREYFKHHLTQVYHRIRKHVLHRARQFVDSGRMDDVNDIFQLHLADVDRAHADPSLEVRALVEEKGALYRKQKAQVRHFPLAIDSRGRLFRPRVFRTDLPEGTIAGAAVSAGIAIGPIKVMNDPFEKEVEPGDILVAVTTDPGWTPLFINAAAVILEIGGELQHGALVAREYGKPCVSGISDVTRVFTDGQIVEVDGDNGLIRIVS